MREQGPRFARGHAPRARLRRVQSDTGKPGTCMGAAVTTLGVSSVWESNTVPV